MLLAGGCHKTRAPKAIQYKGQQQAPSLQPTAKNDHSALPCPAVNHMPQTKPHSPTPSSAQPRQEPGRTQPHLPPAPLPPSAPAPSPAFIDAPRCPRPWPCRPLGCCASGSSFSSGSAFTREPRGPPWAPRWPRPAAPAACPAAVAPSSSSTAPKASASSSTGWASAWERLRRFLSCCCLPPAASPSLSLPGGGGRPGGGDDREVGGGDVSMQSCLRQDGDVPCCCSRLREAMTRAESDLCRCHCGCRHRTPTPALRASPAHPQGPPSVPPATPCSTPRLLPHPPTHLGLSGPAASCPCRPLLGRWCPRWRRHRHGPRRRPCRARQHRSRAPATAAGPPTLCPQTLHPRTCQGNTRGTTTTQAGPARSSATGWVRATQLAPRWVPEAPHAGYDV